MATPAPPATPPATAHIVTVERVVAFLAGVATIWLFWFFIRDRKHRKPCYAVLANTLLRDPAARLPALDVRFSGTPIQSLTVARVAIWNAGREILRAADVARTDPFTLATPDDVRILDARVIQSTSRPGEMTLKQVSESEVRIAFEYLEHCQGSVIEVIHTGTAAEDLAVRGSVQGAAPVRRVKVAEQARNIVAASKRRLSRRARAFRFAALLLGPPVLFALTVPTAALTWSIFGRGYILSALIWALVILFFSWRRGPLPRGFEKIAEGLFDQ
jgi:hypothetical protein